MATPEQQVESMVVRDGVATLTLDRSVYPLEVIYGASYVFVDRCYVLLDAPDPEHVRVVLRVREGDDAALEELAGTFANELLTQVWRQKLAERNRVTIEAVTRRAMAGALAPLPSEEGLPDEGFEGDDAFDDPLGIAVPWEEKYGSGASTEAAADPDAKKEG